MGRTEERTVVTREKELRNWFTDGKDELMKEIDGLDIGWGGSQRWVTSRMPDITGLHLDFACGYGTFLAQIGWRFPGAELYGLNIDFRGFHSCIRRLLKKARVEAGLIQVDARTMPFGTQCFDSVSCFLGLQDVNIGFGEDGVFRSVAAAIRVLETGGHLILVDEFDPSFLLSLIESEGAKVISVDEFVLDVKWSRPVAEAAIRAYSRGWAVQSRASGAKPGGTVFRETYRKMAADMEKQLNDKGFYAPHAPVRMLVAAKL